MQEKVICPICKQFGFKSRVFPIDWNTYFQTIGGYYDEDGNYVKSDIVPTLKESFWCTNGHYWFRTTPY